MPEKQNNCNLINKYILFQLQYSINNISRVNLISKTDLSSNLVNEFSELQGFVSYYYAKFFQENKKIYASLQDQYYPRFANEDIPTCKYSIIICLSDLIDSICCLFKQKNINSDKDPYALRRKALGISKILIKNKINCDLNKIFIFNMYIYLNFIKVEDTFSIINFCISRLKVWYLKQDIPKKIVNAVIKKNADPYDISLRIKATMYFFNQCKQKSSFSIFKRVSNFIIKNQLFNKSRSLETIDPLYIKNASEKNIFFEITKIELLLSKKYCYKQYYTFLLNIVVYVEIFFRDNIIISKDKKISNNRINIILRLNRIFNYVIEMKNL